MSPGLNNILPYGDVSSDGIVQVSFTLPVPCGEKARQAAMLLIRNMRLEDASIALMEPIDASFTYFIAYGRVCKALDYASIEVCDEPYNVMKPDNIDEFVRHKFGRKLTVVGACIGSDAHTVGIDAILNIKGYNRHKGLESYRAIRAINMGAQVSCEDLLAASRRENADALLISQIVTHRGIHIKNLTRMMKLLKTDGLKEKLVLIVGGPGITSELARDLGYDAGFGRGTYPEQVASFLVQKLARQNGAQGND